MNRIFLTLAVCLIAVSSFSSFGADKKIGVIDMEKIFTSYYKTKIEDAKIKKQTEIFRKYMADLNESREKLQKEFNDLRDSSQNIAFSDIERENKRIEAQNKYRQLQAKEAEIQQYNEQKRQQLITEYDKIRKGIVGEITSIVKLKAKEENFIIVVDSSGNTMNSIPVVVYADASLDITDAVLKELNMGNESTAVENK
jgi:Skp family chaperone for outer membrane proteins